MVDKQGKILLNENGLIKQAGAGHGAIFEAMRKMVLYLRCKIKV